MNKNKNLIAHITGFFKLQASGGILLVISALLAVAVANSPFSTYYSQLIDTPFEIRFGSFQLAKPMLLWVNDGLMAIFFFLIGLELKREFIDGELSNVKNIILPGIGAIGGMAVPALIYFTFNYNDAVAVKGWAIPAATDIAFALGALALLGSRVPVSLKVFLTSIAIFDDIGAILIIALFYTSKISFVALTVAMVSIMALFAINRLNVTARSLYVVVGIVMWVAFLKSGVHATLAGVILAMFIPMQSKSDPAYSPVKTFQRDLHYAVAFLILPLFAFCNSGISLKGIGTEQLLHDVPLGIALGLFVGKQVGVFGLCWLGLKMGIAKLPSGLSLKSLYGVSALCGIGFTMSLFIGSLAFEETGANLLFDERLGIIIGSLASGILGFIILRFSLPEVPEKTQSL